MTNAAATAGRKALLITTCDMASGRDEAVAKLMKSLDPSGRPGIEVQHYVLLQRFTETTPMPALPPWVVVEVIPKLISLSAARNLLLKKAFAAKALDWADMVAYPDDDAWYPPGLLPRMMGLLDEHPGLGVVACQFSSKPLEVPATPPRNGRVQDFLRSASSNTIFIRGSIARAIGQFDEQLGLGAAVNGGEDLDYALRALAGSPSPLIIPLALVGHRDPVLWERSRYYPGSLAAILRARGSIPGMRRQTLRKLLVGLALVLRGELRPMGFLRAIGAARKAARILPPSGFT